jgi:alanine-glyoxylate transaminase/serine-glyoxylate transaminase/serine-pyruvate transaminase
MQGTRHLFVPGPTNVPDAVRRALDVPMEDHRAPDLPAFILPLFADLKKFFKSETGVPFLFPASGTGGWEAAITNTLSEGDVVLAARFGQFSHLWIEMCRKMGLTVEVVECDWGTGVPVEIFADRLAADRGHRIKAVLTTQNETATGVQSDIAAVRRALDAAGHPALLFVDGVSSIGSIDFRMEEWGVDLAVSGSQKGFMLPAGLAIMAASQKAMDLAPQARMRRAYFDFRDMAASNATGYFPYTPADAHAAWPARGARPAVRRGAGECLRPAPFPRGRHAARGRGLGADALREGAEMVFRHGQRHRRARRP